ncbi:MAG: efflux RND transporter periplasmic adaptor subunit [Chloroflexia bacterium]|nr:efflux RND transporter periplasmic adaptor subunit [Chloroflexia bacterium]
MKERKVIIAIAIFMILIISFGGMKLLGNLKEEPQQEAKETPKRYVLAHKVEYSKTESHIRASGRLESQDYFDLSTEVQGKILQGSIPLKKGQSFIQGQSIVRIYNKEYVLNLKARKSRFLNSVANLLPDFKVDYPNSYQNWQDFFANIELDKDLPELPKVESEQEKIYLASKNLLSDYYTIKSEEERLRKYTVIAPFSGSFSEVYLHTGSVANPGSRIATIIRTDKLELEVPVNEYEAKWVKTGDAVKVTSESGDQEWQGWVVRKSDFINPTTQSITVFVSLTSTSKNPLLKGMYLNAEFPGVTLAKTMEIPRNAVFNTNQVFTVQDSVLKKEEIIIHKVNEKTLIFSGLKEGTELVMEPLINAAENMKVYVLRNR